MRYASYYEDGTSIGIFMKEFMSLYNGLELAPLRIQYKDFSEWQNKQLKSEKAKKQEEYWLEEMSGEYPYFFLNMPADYPRPSVQSFEGDRINFSAGNEIKEGLNKLAGGTGATLFYWYCLQHTMYCCRNIRGRKT